MTRYLRRSSPQVTMDSGLITPISRQPSFMARARNSRWTLIFTGSPTRRELIRISSVGLGWSLAVARTILPRAIRSRQAASRKRLAVAKRSGLVSSSPR